MAKPTLLPQQDDPDIRLFSGWDDTPGRLDAYGVEWFACDPYPHWFRWVGNTLIEREILWGDTLEYCGGKWWDNPDGYLWLRRDDEDGLRWEWYSPQQCVDEKICPECGREGWSGKYFRNPNSFGLTSGCDGCGFCY